jgi:hypothetical protein
MSYLLILSTSGPLKQATSAGGGQEAVNHQPLTTSYEPRAIGYDPSTISYELYAVFSVAVILSPASPPATV